MKHLQDTILKKYSKEGKELSNSMKAMFKDYLQMREDWEITKAPA